MSRLYLCCLSLLFPIVLTAQQEPVSTQFWNTYLHVNPAMAGLQYRHEAHALYRNQWDKVNGAPNTLFVNYSAKVRALHGGAGVSYSYDVIGFNKQHTMLTHYAFHLPVGKNLLSFGVSAGAVTFSTHPFWVPPSTTNDPLLPASGSTTQFTLNAGAAFHAENWNAGLSVTQLNQPTFRFSNATYTGATHYWLFADYTLRLAEHFSLRPQAQAYTDGVKTGYSVSILGIMRQNGWAGISYSHDNYIGIMGGYDFKGKYRIGYGYDLTLNPLNTVSRGTHEIVIGYLLR